MKVVIDRAKWNTGHRLSDKSVLRNAREERCCLGFLGEACGVPASGLEDVFYPLSPAICSIYAPACSRAWPAALFERAPHEARDTQWRHVFAVLNDYNQSIIDDATRESWISDGFRIVLGCEVEFVGAYPEVKP